MARERHPYAVMLDEFPDHCDALKVKLHEDDSVSFMDEVCMLNDACEELERLGRATYRYQLMAYDVRVA